MNPGTAEEEEDADLAVMCLHVGNLFQVHSRRNIIMENLSGTWRIYVSVPTCSTRGSPPALPALHPLQPRPVPHLARQLPRTRLQLSCCPGKLSVEVYV